MKKTIIVCIVLAAATSCSRKDRTCTCTNSPGGADVFTITHATKKEAQAKCISYTETDNGSTFTRDCKLSK